ncbi:MAG: hypothetical protein ACLU3I_11770 [Acutalibacteraceae bacterium]
MIDGQILVDCGVPYKVVKPVAKALRLVLADTLAREITSGKSTLHALAADRPALRFRCCRWMVRPLVEAGVKPANIDLYDFDRRYSYGDFTVEPVPLVHDVPNCGYKLQLPPERSSTPPTQTTCTVFRRRISTSICWKRTTRTKKFRPESAEKKANGEFVYERRVLGTHLSKAKCDDFIYQEHRADRRVRLPARPRRGGKSVNGFLKDITYARSGEYILSIYTRESCKDLWKNFGERPITFSIAKKADHRGLRANSYAWALIEQLAAKLKTDKESVYEEMIRRYGVGESYIDEAGNECKVLFSLRDGVPPRLVARHYAEIGIGYIEGKKFIHYRALKGTSEYTAAEMAAFLDGIIAECEEQGVQTGPPEKTAQYKEAKKP